MTIEVDRYVCLFGIDKKNSWSIIYIYDIEESIPLIPYFTAIFKRVFVMIKMFAMI